MVTMAVFDIIYSIAASLVAIPRPADDMFVAYAERGKNEASCLAQGWFTQWGSMTSIFLNASLSTCKLKATFPPLSNRQTLLSPLI
jgi:hypothetical protein